ncbi:hypothetical protein EA756_06445 [Acinetobacter lactucae]|uniref:Heme-binding protein n=1 Tax=Acinetobacter lactucae TaxID=1785128 RepID=A0A3R9QJG2_9GAMM|nr:hypothetical protein [Acinetobacter lactucae]RSO58820.1 hypothetical protein EA756_06445 [Acinetobacter lactucae]
MNRNILQSYEDIKSIIIPFVKEIMTAPNVQAEAYVIIIMENGKLIEQTIISDVPQEKWIAPFDELALAKAKLSERTGLPSREVIQQKQDLLQPGDTCWFGSVIDKNKNLIVAASGGPEEADELIASTILSLIELQKKLSIINQLNERGPNHKFII